MAARGKSENHFVEQLEKLVPFITEKMVPFIASERPVRHDVSGFASGVNKFDLDHWVMVDLVRPPVKCHSASAGKVLHRRASRH